MPRTAALLLLPIAAVTLAACGSDGDDSPIQPAPSTASPATCSSTAPTGTAPTAKGTVLCLGTPAITALGKATGRARVTVTSVTQAPAAALAALDLGTAEGDKSGAALWYVTVTATATGGAADLDFTDPADAVALTATDGRHAASYVGSHPDGCAPAKFSDPAVGTSVTSCAWSLLRAGEKPAVVLFAPSSATLTPTLRWKV